MVESKENRILKELKITKNFSEKEAKRIFRRYSKLIHPDITKTDTNEEFINLKREFEEALVVIKNPFLLGNILREEEEEAQKPENIREKIYKMLSIYVALGIYSQKVRIKKELKDRNEKIIETIIDLGRLYDPEFSRLFESFNSFYFQPFDEWYEERQLKNARKLFISGIRKFLDYQRNGNVMNLRMATSYLNDAYYEYTYRAKSDYHRNILNLIQWFISELSKPPLLKEFY
ncbi:MAG: hypothetical protein ACP5QT_03910 [Brevinematia bacterium]